MRPRVHVRLPSLSAFVFILGACSSTSGTDTSAPGDGADGAADGADGSGDGAPGDGGEADGDPTSDGDDDRPPVTIVETLPPGFTPGTSAGGYQVVGKLEDFEVSDDNSCANVLRAVVRDFQQEHIDFGQQKPASWMDPGLYTNQVLTDLGADKKPQINPSRTPLDVIERLEDWYATKPGTNQAYVMDFWLQPDAARPGTFVFDMNDFFPLDEVNEHPDDVQVGGQVDQGPHNFLFTTEIHTAFEYKAGQVFSFRGDDDVFVFIDGKLVVDLGGIHGPISGSVQLDTLGLTVGEVYPLDMFQAERNPGGSNFRIDTSLDFKSCDVLVDVL